MQILIAQHFVNGVIERTLVDISDWTATGANGRPAMQCSREEVVRETWNQLMC
jgi:hypothetical protein